MSSPPPPADACQSVAQAEVAFLISAANLWTTATSQTKFCWQIAGAQPNAQNGIDAAVNAAWQTYQTTAQLKRNEFRTTQANAASSFRSTVAQAGKTYVTTVTGASQWKLEKSDLPIQGSADGTITTNATVGTQFVPGAFRMAPPAAEPQSNSPKTTTGFGSDDLEWIYLMSRAGRFEKHPDTECGHGAGT